MKKIFNKKAVVFVVVLCIIVLASYVYFQQNDLQSGSGTFDDPYLVAECQEIEDNFKNYYESDLLEASDISFDESTRLDWKNNNVKNNESIVIDEIQYFGKERTADLMIIVNRDQIDKDLSQYLDDKFSHDEDMVTTSQYKMEFDLTNKDYKNTNKTLFVQRLANEVLNNSRLMIFSYRIQIDQEWYQGYTMIIEDKIDYIMVPDKNYGEGDLIEG